MDYLRKHKDFFLQHPDLLVSLDIPHPEGDGVVSLIERQVEVLRQKHKHEQDQLYALVQTARDNERVAERLHRVAVEILSFGDLDDALDSVSPLIKESFSVDHVSLRISSDKTGRHELVDPRSSVYADLYHRIAAGRSVCDNQLSNVARDFLFGGDVEVRSVALIPLGSGRPHGLLALGSAEADRFTSEQGTFYLDRLGELLGSAIRRLSSA